MPSSACAARYLMQILYGERARFINPMAFNEQLTIVACSRLLLVCRLFPRLATTHNNRLRTSTLRLSADHVIIGRRRCQLLLSNATMVVIQDKFDLEQHSVQYSGPRCQWFKYWTLFGLGDGFRSALSPSLPLTTAHV